MIAKLFSKYRCHTDVNLPLAIGISLNDERTVYITRNSEGRSEPYGFFMTLGTPFRSDKQLYIASPRCRPLEHTSHFLKLKEHHKYLENMYWDRVSDDS